MKYTPQIPDFTEFDSRRSVVRSQSNQINEIGSVDITQPTDLATGISPTGDIVWDALPDFSRYRLIVTKQSDGAEVINATVEGTSYTPSFDASTGYDIQVFTARKIPQEQQEIVVSISGSATDLQEGSTRQFTANVPVTWSVDNGTISTSGLYTADGTQGPVTVTGASTVDDTKSDSITFDVVAQSDAGLDSEAGDIATLEAIATSTSADTITGWATTGMSLDPAPQGITVANIGNELRVTGIDLKNLGLTGHVNIPEWKNLKQCELVNFVLNALDTELPQELMDLADQSLKHLYVCASDDETEEFATQQMHDYVYTDSVVDELHFIHTGKTKGNEKNIIRGSLNAPANSSQSKLENFVMTWPEDQSDNTGISSIDPDFFNQTNFKIMVIRINKEVNEQPFPSQLPFTNITHFYTIANNLFNGTVTTQLNSLTQVQHLDLRTQRNLTYDWNQIDLRNYHYRFQYFLPRAGNHIGPYPSYLHDGRFTRIENITMPGINGPGFTGSLGEFSADSGGLSTYVVNRHQISGSIPLSLFSNVGGLILCNLNGNQFSSFESINLTSFGGCRYLKYEYNIIRGQQAPYFDWTISIRDFYINYNLYVFKDFLYVPPNAPAGETWFQLIQTITSDFRYSVQKRFGTVHDIVGNEIDFSAHVGHVDNVYEWQLSTDGGTTFNTVAGEITPSINFDTHGAGIYRLIVSNSNISDLVTSRESTSYVTPDTHFQSVEIEI